jgi:uncharacterized protein
MSGVEVLIGIAMLVGLVGIVVPFLPGVILIWGAGVLWAVTLPGGTWTAWLAVGLMTALGIAGLVAAAILPSRRATEVGAPGWVLVVGAVGMVVGFFAIPVVGALLGWPLGVFLAEVARLRDARSAWRTTVSTLKGMGIGIGVELVAAVAMIGVWIAAVVMT